jgi:glutaredoxin 3
MKIVIYSKHYCPWCIKAKELLKRQNLNYQEYFIGSDLTKDEFLDIVGSNVKTVPQIIIDGRRIGGYEDLVDYLNRA